MNSAMPGFRGSLHCARGQLTHEHRRFIRFPLYHFRRANDFRPQTAAEAVTLMPPPYAPDFDYTTARTMSATPII